MAVPPRVDRVRERLAGDDGLLERLTADRGFLERSTIGRGPFDRLTVDHAFVAVVVAVWAGLYLHGLGEHPLRVWDESRYAVPARQMVEGGGWLDPKIRVNTHGGDLGLTPRLVKPPLVYWLQATAMSAFGITTFAARLPTALATLGCAGLVYHLGRRTYDRRAGLAGALVFLIFPGMLLGSHGGRAAVTDTTLALFGSGFVWFTWRGRVRPRLLVVAGACAGLAVMTKGVAAGVFVVAVFPILLRYRRAYYGPWTVAAVATTVAIALPWHLYAWLSYGEEFVDQYFRTAVASRVEGEMTGPPADPIFEFMNYPYVRYAVELFVPPYPHALPAFGLGIVCALGLVGWLLRRDGPGDHAEKVVLLWWAAAVPLTFAVAGGNHAWYILPMYVPGAVLVGYVPAAVADGTAGSALRSVLDRARPESTGVGPDSSRRAGPKPGSSPDRTGSEPDSPRNRPDSKLAPLRDRADHVRARVGSIARRWRRRSSTTRTVGYVVACLCVASLLVAGYAPPPTEAHDVEQRELGETVSAEVPDDGRIHVLLDAGVERRSLMSLSFYADRPLERATRERVRTDPNVRYAIVPAGDRGWLDRDHRVLVEGPVDGIAVVAFADDRGEGGG